MEPDCGGQPIDVLEMLLERPGEPVCARDIDLRVGGIHRFLNVRIGCCI